jgi:integrase
VHLGYRRLRGAAGKWVVRHYNNDGTYELAVFAVADDTCDANGTSILSFDAAVAEARRLRDERARAAAAGFANFTVGNCLDVYAKQRAAEGANMIDLMARLNMIRSRLGDIAMADLTAPMIKDWLADIVTSPPRLRTKKGAPQAHRDLSDDPEALRKRRATANRLLSVLKAALNRAWNDERFAVARPCWVGVRKFKGVDAARPRFLTMDEIARLLNASPPDFHRLCRAGLEIGARYSELARLKVGDFHAESGTVTIQRSKSGKFRHCHLTARGVEFFQSLVAGRAADRLMLTQPSGEPWGPSCQQKPFEDAARVAGIAGASFHALRHSWASHSVMAGVPLLVVARQLGHSGVAMVERHYAHLAPSFEARAIREGAPDLGPIDSNLKVLGSRR